MVVIIGCPLSAVNICFKSHLLNLWVERRQATHEYPYRNENVALEPQ